MIKNRWVDSEANTFVEQHADKGINVDLALRVYTSQLIGSDPDLVMHGGGNTSCKTLINDVFGKEIQVLCVKGSGWDLATIEVPGLPAVKIDALLELRCLDALSDEAMVNLQRGNLLDQMSPNPSVETLLHAFLPHAFVDHTHATAFLALANLPEPEAVAAEIFGDKMAIVPYVMPGFELAKDAASVADNNPKAEALLLLQHGHFTWGASAKESYDRVVSHTNSVAAWFADQREGVSYQVKSLKNEQTKKIIHYLTRALFSNSTKLAPSFVINWICTPEVVGKIDQYIHQGVIERGVATPDHVIRIKPKPLMLPQTVYQDGPKAIDDTVRAYVKGYKKYFDTWSVKVADKKIMLDPLPKIAWVEGIGLFGIGGSAKEACTITDLGIQNLNVADDAERAGGFYPASEKNLFDMEYWSLEQAKLSKSAQPALHGKVTVVTGAGGVIGSAIVKKFSQLGAEVIAVDMNEDALAAQDFSSSVTMKKLDLTDEERINALVDDVVYQFGGVDILISNAGIAPQSSLLEMDLTFLRKSFEINFFAHFNLAKAIAQLFVVQKNKGQLLFNVSKQAVNTGRNFGAYGLPKSTLMFMVKQMALELGEYGIRVNGVNADKIRSGILDDQMIKSRAAARGVSIDSYMTGNLLGEEVNASHVADCFYSLAMSERTTGHIMTVDGGNIESSLR